MGFKSSINLSNFKNVLSFPLTLLLIGDHKGSWIHVAVSQRETLNIWKAGEETDQGIFPAFALYEIDKVRQVKTRLLMSLMSESLVSDPPTLWHTVAWIISFPLSSLGTAMAATFHSRNVLASFTLAFLHFET